MTGLSIVPVSRIAPPFDLAVVLFAASRPRVAALGLWVPGAAAGGVWVVGAAAGGVWHPGVAAGQAE